MQQTDKEDENMKKFINQVELVEDQMIQGMVKAYPQYVRKLDCGNVVVRTEKKEGKVALISGGGSGHEPAHGGYVGTGMMRRSRAQSLPRLRRIRSMRASRPSRPTRAF